MDFSDALLMLRSGRRVARSGWNAAWQYVVLADSAAVLGHVIEGALALQPGEAARMRPFLLLHTAADEWVPWTVSQSDVLGDDWGVAD